MRAAYVSGLVIVAVAGAFVAGKASTTHTPAPAAVRLAAPSRVVQVANNDEAADAAAASPDAASEATEAFDAVCAAMAADGNLSRDQFTRCVQGKSMEQVRHAYGSPYRVDTDVYGVTTWYYPHAPVYDAAAAIQIAASVDFAKDGTATGAHY